MSERICIVCGKLGTHPGCINRAYAEEMKGVCPRCGADTSDLYGYGPCNKCAHEVLAEEDTDEVSRLRFAIIQMANALSKETGIVASTILFHVTGLRWREVAVEQPDRDTPEHL